MFVNETQSVRSNGFVTAIQRPAGAFRTIVHQVVQAPRCFIMAATSPPVVTSVAVASPSMPAAAATTVMGASTPAYASGGAPAYACGGAPAYAFGGTPAYASGGLPAASVAAPAQVRLVASQPAVLIRQQPQQPYQAGGGELPPQAWQLLGRLQEEAHAQGVSPGALVFRDAAVSVGTPVAASVPTQSLAAALVSIVQVAFVRTASVDGGISSSEANRLMEEGAEAIARAAAKGGSSVSLEALEELIAECKESKGVHSERLAANYAGNLLQRALSGELASDSPVHQAFMPSREAVAGWTPQVGQAVQTHYLVGDHRSRDAVAARVTRLVQPDSVEVAFSNGVRQVLPASWLQGGGGGAEVHGIVQHPSHEATKASGVLSYTTGTSGVHRFIAGTPAAIAAMAGRVGLQNVGNTCYMSSCLQCLAGTIDLVKYFLSPAGIEHELNVENFLGSGGKVAREFATLMRTLWCGNQQVVAPWQFKKVLGEAAIQFAGSEQHDSQEFASYLLDCLHEDLNRVRGKKPTVTFPDLTPKVIEEKGEERAAAECWNLYLQRDKSIIVDIFQGQLRSQITCRQCRYLSTKFDAFMYLSLPVVDEGGNPLSTLDACLHEFSKDEHLCGDDQWYCPECKAHVDAVKTIAVWKLPPVLIVHLKRFKYGGGPGRPAQATATWTQALYGGLCGATSLGSTEASGGGSHKLTHKVHIPLTGLDLQESGALPMTAAYKVPPVFDLFALVNHMGGCRMGHYTAHVKHDQTGIWNSFNDAIVHPIHEEEVASEKAYLLFFRLRGALIRTQTMSSPESWPHVIERAWSFLPPMGDDEEAT